MKQNANEMNENMTHVKHELIKSRLKGEMATREADGKGIVHGPSVTRRASRKIKELQPGRDQSVVYTSTPKWDRFSNNREMLELFVRCLQSWSKLPELI